MRLDDGRVVVMVSRGWVPRSLGRRRTTAATHRRPRPESVEVLGRVIAGGRSVEAASAAASDTRSRGPRSAVSTSHQRGTDALAIDDLERRSWVQLDEQAPPLGDLPVPVPLARASTRGPHLVVCVPVVLLLGRDRGCVWADPARRRTREAPGGRMIEPRHSHPARGAATEQGGERTRAVSETFDALLGGDPADASHRAARREPSSWNRCACAARRIGGTR